MPKCGRYSQKLEPKHMVSKLGCQISVHLAGHAVLGTGFGLVFKLVTVHSDDPMVVHESAAPLARNLDVHSQIEACEKDAIVALAGLAANRRENPRLRIYDVMTE